MDLMLDTNIVLDLCTPRLQWYAQTKKAVDKCAVHGGRIWLYTGSVQTIEYNLRRTLAEKTLEDNQILSNRQIAHMTRVILAEFSRDKHWLAALATEGDVFDTDDPEDEQLTRALMRFPEGTIRLLTRDRVFLEKHPQLTILPQQYLQIKETTQKINFIDLAAQQDTIRPQLEKNIHTVLHHGRYILGPEVKEFENRLCEYTGVKHCIGVSSGTDALLMCLMAANVGPGDAVFTTPFTFIATAEVVSLLGAIPVFVDIDPQTYNLDPIRLEIAIKSVIDNDSANYPLATSSSPCPLKPKAIIPVDLFGLPADYDPIMNLAKKYNLFVVEDAAQGLGGLYNGRAAGGLAHMGATSFFPAKPLGCYGDGGAIFTNDDTLADMARSIRVHGKGTDKYDNIRIGLNARLHTMQAAILLTKLGRFPQELASKQKVAAAYTELFTPHQPALTPPFVPEGTNSAWAQYSMLSENREAIMAGLKEKNIPAAVYYAKPLHLQPAYRHLGYQPGDMPVSEQISQQIFSLPMHGYLTAGEIKHIVTGVTMSL